MKKLTVLTISALFFVTACSENLLLVTEPPTDQPLSIPQTISGQAHGSWYFEGEFGYQLQDQNGNVLSESFLLAQEDWMQDDLVAFSGEITSALPPETTKGKIIFQNANPSGLPENSKSFEYTVTFGDYETVSVFFAPAEVGNDCSVVEEVERMIPATVAPARPSIEQLIAGPLFSERAAGLTTGINPETTIQSLVVEEGVAKLDLSPEFLNELAGSCKVQSVRAQIENTLLQFATVESVEITVDGEADGVLEP